MTYNAAAAARRFRDIGLESRVFDTDPHTLVLMMFDGALERLAAAQAALASGDVRRRVEALAATARIVDGLRQSLNLDAGGALASRLDALYDYLGRRLLQASLRQDAAALAEVAERLGELRAAWSAIGTRAA